ncbi:GFA family protein [Reyranella sp.]|uniref:GFA family protein n=1 Tax=Reyranella sp. TaxID=1929291 RepID=UPI003D14AB43
MITGGCLCGALRYRAEGEPLLQGLCHCRNCQRMSGAGHAGFICFAEDAVTVEGETRSYASTGGSGTIATRYSCPTCHSVVFGRAEAMPGRINLYAGSLDDTSQFKPQVAIFTRSRPPWDDSSRGLMCYEKVPGG